MSVLFWCGVVLFFFAKVAPFIGLLLTDKRANHFERFGYLYAMCSMGIPWFCKVVGETSWFGLF